MAPVHKPRFTAIILLQTALPVAGLLLAALPAVAGAAGQKTIAVNWDDPEIKGFAETRSANMSAGIEAESDSKLTKLKIPVLAFERPPEAVSRNLRAGPEAAPERIEHFDPANPIWYQIVEDYGDVTVSVEADLRVQNTFDAGHPVYDNANRSAGISDEPQVSVMDEASEEGMEGYIAEYTITRFGVPYTVTVECTAEAKEQCKDSAQLAKDSALLKLVGGEKPN